MRYKDKIIIKDLMVTGILGIYDRERITPQRICINIIMHTDIQQAGEQDDLTLSIDYAQMVERVTKHAETAAPLTAEALATQIASLCLENARVASVIVRVEKPDALQSAASVGVEIERWQ